MNLVCKQCEKVFLVDEPPKRGAVCFGCHIKTVRLGFTYGQEDFHGPTIRERATKTIEDAKINGYDPQFVGSRWI